MDAVVLREGQYQKGYSDVRRQDAKPEDVIKRVDPDYPYEDRRNYRQGKGLYRAFVDLKTGAVTNVIIIKPTKRANEQ